MVTGSRALSKSQAQQEWGVGLSGMEPGMPVSRRESCSHHLKIDAEVLFLLV